MEDKLDEKFINAKFAALIAQRNESLNTVVNLSGDIEMLKLQNEHLDSKCKSLEVDKKHLTEQLSELSGDVEVIADPEVV